MATIFCERKQDTSVETGGVTRTMSKEIQIDVLKSRLNDKQNNKSGKKYASLIRSVDKGTCTFLLLRQSATQLHVYMRANFLVKFHS